ncbi:hypothetical protein PHYSODRAFT_300671 [Phytophthora sojae]|uniref:Uncharacterized protein n=1 Tax=Phytophthora sojae (strain P6497) TaxID=1094619 RepID=G4ZI33_PHYSP|nr:hypothetical protein PHYSODRAFT_300671 [Phytophthora sojae]EGZ17676.1 hypothetical protein PHYSODRAFT_300671 [Phytophthora sojae]|eukprot:XP_009526734.1 hypothetical protein PHYSODRAFT_300671 [Phytophthora sojae]
MYALAPFDGSQHSEDHHPGTMDQLTHLHRRRQVTLQEDFVQVNGKPEELCSIRHDAEQQALAIVEHRVDPIVASTRYEFEHAAALMEQKMQLRLEESFRASHAAAQSTVCDAVQAISGRVDSAEAILVEARARLDEALDIHVANSQLIAPENIRQQIAELCEEGVHEALRSAQVSFNAAVEEKAERHASLIE